MRLEPLLTPDCVLALDGLDSRESVFGQLADRAASLLGSVEAPDLLRVLEEREAKYPTTTPEGIAFPHGLLPKIERTVLLAARLRPAVAFEGSPHPPVDLVLCIVGAEERPFGHVQLLARLARVVRHEDARDRILAATDAGALRDALITEDRAHDG